MRDLLAFLAKYIYAWLSCLYLFTIGIFVPRNRPLISRICSHFGYRRGGNIPEVSLLEAAPDNIPVEIHELVGVLGNVSLLESIVIARLVRLNKAVNIFEFGTFDGRTTLNLAANSAPGSKVYTLDLPKESVNSTRLPLAPAEKDLIEKGTTGEKFRGTEWEKKIVQLTGDSAVFDFSPYDGQMDLVFVDGSHSCEYVLNDSSRALKLLKKGGLIVWHDYGTEGWEGVNRVLTELCAKGGGFENMRRISGTSLVCLKL